MDFIAHYRREDETPQLLATHLREVQAHCEEIGAKIGAAHIVGLAGMFHDFGKYSTEFQSYIQEAIENPDVPPKRGSVDHSTAGGQIILQLTKHEPKLQPICELIANAIYGHHGTLLDFLNEDGESPFFNRHTVHPELKTMLGHFFREVMPAQELMHYLQHVQTEYELLQAKMNKKEVLHFFLAKYIFSALIDADRTNARQFDENEARQSTTAPPFALYEERLQQALADKQKNAVPNDITRARQYLSDQCFDKATLPTGIYTLSIPTGGGKTLASLRFALRHAQLHQQERIIQIVPFTTIIEQNAQETRDVLQTDDLLEHHSNIIEERDESQLTYEEYEQRRKIQRAKDNWDMPLIFSTMVQFLNIAYEKSSRYTRRFHHLANSVIIFDEIQALPIKTISLFNECATFLKEVCGATIILCTATQPALQSVKHHLTIDGELIDNLPAILPNFKRTNVIPCIRESLWTIEDVADFANEQMQHVRNVLIVVNTKRDARQLYEQLKGQGGVYHLSTSMCPKHRQQILKEMRDKLDAREQLICISTQLIEAGVDVSFQCVIRALAGLDSIAQSAGRCNRNGEVATRDVYVVNMKLPKRHFLPTIVEGAKQTTLLLRDDEANAKNLLAPDIMTVYFSEFYNAFKHEQHFSIKGQEHTLYDLAFSKDGHWLEGSMPQNLRHHYAFKTVGRYFEVIDSATTAVLVPYEDEGKELIASLEAREIDDFSHFLKKAQHYSVNVFAYERKLLERSQMLAVYETPFSHIYYVREGAYSDEYGLDIQGDADLSLMTM
ncbi:MAG: CRISPR-associated helicase Cas3' [Caryophanon sp.]|nr:CRISPR-associated helicase Cas3' [Caryophanon sp.]